MTRTVILCAKCVVRVTPPRRAMPNDEVRCPDCDQVDTLAKVLSDARNHATHVAKHELERRMSETGQSVRHRTPTRVPVKNLRWITGIAS